jgi:transcriptional regulator with XRE-family HTH domain
MIVQVARLYELMTLNEMSIASLSTKVGVKFSTISRILSGETKKPQIETLLSVATVFDVDLKELMCYSDALELKEGYKLFNNTKEVVVYFMEKLGIKSVALLCKSSGVPKCVLNRILSGETKNPNNETLKKLGAYLGLSIDQLRCLTPINVGDGLGNHANRTDIPVIKSSDLLAWCSSRAVSLVCEYTYSAKYIDTESFAVKLVDDTLEPFFMHNSLLVIDTSSDLPEKGYVLVKSNKNQIIMYRVSYDDNLKQAMLTNLANGQVEKYTDINQLHVVGTVIQEIRDLV